MRRFWGAFQGLRFRNKMAVSYIALALIPFLALALVGGSIFLGQARNTAMDHTSQITGQVSSAIDIYISGLDKTADYLSRYVQGSGMLDMARQDARWQSGQFNLQKHLDEIAASHPEVAGILVAMDDDRYVISTGMSRISRDPFDQEGWYLQAVAQPDSLSLISTATGRNIVTKKDYSADDVFSIARAIPDPASGEPRGVVLMDVRHDIIRNSINQVTIGQEGFVFVLDEQNNIVYAPQNELVYRVDPRWLGEDRPVNAGIQGGQYHIRSRDSAYTGWKTVGVFSFDEVMSGVTALYPILIVCAVILVCLVAVASIWLADSVTKPISKLQRLMSEAESGDLSVRFNSLYNDEVGALGQSFNHMIDRIDGLIHRVYQEQQSKRDAELKSLQEQIKPHFLYNTLDTIGWMARDYEAKNIVLLVDALTSMFRIGLSHGKDFISVKEETTHVTNYLYIQQIRYQELLNYDIQVPEALYPYQVPKLILQPLVENAIYHGIKQKEEGGTIRISGTVAEDGALVFTVRDDGAGMAPAPLTLLQEQLHQVLTLTERPSFGIFYVAERIKLCYGEEYGVTIDSTEGEWTAVSVRLPALDNIHPATPPTFRRDNREESHV